MSELVQEIRAELPKPNYRYITTEEEAHTVMSELDAYPVYQIDTETTALDPYEARWSLLQIGVPNQQFVFDVRCDTERSSLNPEILKPILTDPSKKKILQNAAYDMKIVKRNLEFYLNNVYDTMLTEQLLNLGLFVKADLGSLVFKYLGLYMSKEPRGTFEDYGQKFEPYQLEYAANDVVPLSVIADTQWGNIQKEKLENVAQLEFDFLKPLCEMELNGVLIDVDKWRLVMKDVEKERDKVKQIIVNILTEQESQSTMFGVSLINIDSAAQLKKALNSYGLKLDSTSADTLGKHKGIPVIDAILDYRGLQKLMSSYSESLLEKINPHTGRLHTSFKQMVSTGRMSSSNPNLQQIPGKQKFRSCFIAKDGYTLLTSDLSGAELRILGNLSQDPVFIEAYATGQDLHTRTAAEIFDVDYGKVEGHMRKAAKAINFGLCVQEDSIVFTSEGPQKIKDICINQTVHHDEGQDLVIDHKYMGEKEVYELTSQYGYSLELTEDHLIKVIDCNGNYIDKKLKDLDSESDYVCIKKGSNLFPSEDFKFNSFEYSNNRHHKNIDIPGKVTEDLAIFLGLFVSEGSVSERGKVTFKISSKIGEYKMLFDSLFKRLFKDDFYFYNYKKRNILTYSVLSVKYQDWIKHICAIKGISNKTQNIGIPDCIKCSTKNIQSKFLSALFEGDGCIKRSGENRVDIFYDSSSHRLIRDLKLMLLNFGILTTIWEKKDLRYPKNNYYTLALVGNKGKEIFFDDIGFLTNYKNGKYINNKNTQIQSTYFLPNQEDRFKKVNAMLGRAKIPYSMIKRGKIGDVPLRELSQYDPFFEFIYENEIVPLPIKSIKAKGVKKVYDLSVNNHQYFLANGFVVHNCYGMSAVGLAQRLNISKKEAKLMIAKYFNKYKVIKRYLDKSGKDAVRNRSSKSISGRKRFYNMPPFDHPDRKFIQGSIERRGKNMPIQACLVGDTKVSGQGNISLCKDKLVNIDTAFGKDTAKGVYSGKRDVYNLKLSNGSVLGITLNHEIPVVSSEGLVDKKVKDIDFKNDYLLVPIEAVEGNTTNLEGYTYEKGHWRETYKEFDLPKFMTNDLAFILGCLIGDGSYTKHNHFRFVCPEYRIELLNKFNASITKLFGYTPVVREIDRNNHNSILYTSQVSSVVIRGFLRHIGLDYVVHRDKKIPHYFFTETIENKGAILNGLFSTDGGFIKKSGLNYTTISRALASDIQNLLFSLGINSNLKTYKEKGSLVYRIQIPKRFNRKFKKLVGFAVTKKSTDLDNNLDQPKNGGGSLVPDYISKSIESGLRNSSIYNNLSYNDKAHLRQFSLGRSSFSSWRKFYNLLPVGKVKQELSKFLDFDFCRPVSLEYKGVEDTYDIVCDNIHYFIANGVVVHNSNADVIKKAMILLIERLKPYDARLLLTVHDEVVVEVRNDQAKEVASIVESSMLDGFNEFFSVIPMETDVLQGPCWLKGACEAKIGDTKCGSTEMRFTSHKKFGTKLVCAKCGTSQE